MRSLFQEEASTGKKDSFTSTRLQDVKGRSETFEMLEGGGKVLNPHAESTSNTAEAFKS